MNGRGVKKVLTHPVGKGTRLKIGRVDPGIVAKEKIVTSIIKSIA